MEMEILARHFTLGDDQREIIEAMLEKLEKFSPRPVQSCHVTIAHDAGRFATDGVLRLKSQEFRASAEEREPELAVSEMAENLRKQLAKFKGKISGKQKGENGGLGRVMPAGLEQAADAAESPLGFVLRDMDVESAKEDFSAHDQPFLVFRNVANSRVGVIYRRDDGAIGHMESRGD